MRGRAEVPLLAAPREDPELRREPLIEAIESAFLHGIEPARFFVVFVKDKGAPALIPTK